ncbi:MAG: hypothetical protein ACFFDK_17860 [Promethearchaeota archaeon]
MGNNYRGKSHKEIKKYSERYGLLDVINTKYGSLNETKISRFVILINDFIEKLAPNELNSSLNLTHYKRYIIKVVNILSNYIRIGDNLLDSFYLERTNENYKKFLRELATLAISSWNIQTYFKKLPIDGNKLVLKALFNIKEVAEMEDSLRENPRKISDKQLINFTLKRNSDFFLYYSFLTPFIAKEVNEIVFKFLNNYVILDNLLDDMTDLYVDNRNRNFNILLLDLKVKNPTFKGKIYKDLINELIENRVYQNIFSLFKKHYDLATNSIANYHSRFFEYLRFLLNGSFEGFNLFKKNNYFVFLLNSEPNIHKHICELLFKPYPWSTISYEIIFTKLPK